MNYREFLFVLSCLEWEEISFTVLNNDGGFSEVVHSIEEADSILKESYHFDRDHQDNCDRITIQDIKLKY